MRFQKPVSKLHWTLLCLVPGALVLFFILLSKAGAVGDYPIIQDVYLMLVALCGGVMLAFRLESVETCLRLRFWLGVAGLAAVLAVTVWSIAGHGDLWRAVLAA